MLLQPGILGLAWGPAIRQLGAGLGVTVDAITESYERVPAPEGFDIAAGHIPAGGLAALRFEVRGIVAGEPVIVIEHITRLREDLCPEWPQPAQSGGSYRVEIVGEPSYHVDVRPASRKGDHNHAAIVAAAGRIVNSIPAVVAAPPGIRTTLDLPLITRPGSSRPRPENRRTLSATFPSAAGSSPRKDGIAGGSQYRGCRLRWGGRCGLDVSKECSQRQIMVRRSMVDHCLEKLEYQLIIFLEPCLECGLGHLVASPA